MPCRSMPALPAAGGASGLPPAHPCLDAPPRPACPRPGGHTAEMMALLQGFDLSVYSPRCYVVAATDGMSGAKAAAFEAAAAPTVCADEEAPGSARKRTPGRGATTPAKQAVAQQAVRRSPRVAAAARQQQAAAAAGRRQLPGARSPESPAKRRMAAAAAAAGQQQEQYSVVVIPRSREVGQSFLTSVPTTLRALWSAGGWAGVGGAWRVWLRFAADWKEGTGGGCLVVLAVWHMAERVLCVTSPSPSAPPAPACSGGGAGAAARCGAAQRPRHLHPHCSCCRAAAVRWEGGGGVEESWYWADRSVVGCLECHTRPPRPPGCTAQPRAIPTLPPPTAPLARRRLLGVCRGRVVYVESIARVYRLSLSGKILYHARLAAPFFVQVRVRAEGGRAGRCLLLWCWACVALCCFLLSPSHPPLLLPAAAVGGAAGAVPAGRVRGAADVTACSCSDPLLSLAVPALATTHTHHKRERAAHSKPQPLWPSVVGAVLTQQALQEGGTQGWCSVVRVMLPA